MCRTVSRDSILQQKALFLFFSPLLLCSLQLHNEHHEFTPNVIELYTVGRRPNTCANLRHNQGNAFHFLSPLQNGSALLNSTIFTDRPIHRIYCQQFSM